MFQHLVSRSPERYERWKDRLKRNLPRDGAIRRGVASLMSTAHQKYIEDFVFIHINKCGGTSVERALGIPLLNHDTASERRQKLGEKAWNRRFKFAVVRDPYDRAASLFFYRHRDQESFAPDELPQRFTDWLGTIVEKHRDGSAGRMVMPQAYWVTDSRGSLLLDYLCPLERLDEGLEAVRNALGRPIKVPQLKRGRQQLDYHSIYSSDSRAIVNSLFAADFELLDYARIEP